MSVKIDIPMAVARFADQLASERRRRCLTQKQLANRTGLTVRHIQYLEGGERMASLGTILKLARGLDLEPYELLRNLT